MLGALVSGTPQLVLPQGADQFFNADALVSADLATSIEPAQLAAEAVAKFADEALRVSRPAAERTRREIATMPHPSLVVERLADQFAR